MPWSVPSFSSPLHRWASSHKANRVPSFFTCDVCWRRQCRERGESKQRDLSQSSLAMGADRLGNVTRSTQKGGSLYCRAQARILCESLSCSPCSQPNGMPITASHTVCLGRSFSLPLSLGCHKYWPIIPGHLTSRGRQQGREQLRRSRDHNILWPYKEKEPCVRFPLPWLFATAFATLLCDCC